jgi:hypothetical protein
MWRSNLSLRLSTLCLTLAALAVLLCAGVAVRAGVLGDRRAVGGVAVDANGVVRQVTVTERNENLKRLRQAVDPAAPELAAPAELRRVSLRGLEAALQEALQQHQGQVPDDIVFLAGLQRIQYVFVYPEQNDIVLAGPGEGWKVDEQANLVGATSGQPVLRLEDLLIALRTVEAARREGISVSIDPTEEGRRNFRQLMSGQRVFTPAVLQGIEQAMGPQQVSFTGVPINTHFAQVLVAADYRMKRLAMNLDQAPIENLPGFLDLLNARRRMPSNAMPRWWLACNYEPLVRSEDRLAWELRGPGVKAMTEDELIQADGTVRATGQEDPVAKEWADRMTERYEELARKEPVFAQLRNVMDMCIVAALIERENLCDLAGASFPLLTGRQDGIALDNWNPPKTVPTQVSYLRIGRSYVITASGGVQIDSWQVASQSVVDPPVAAVQAKSAPPDGSSWWW